MRKERSAGKSCLKIEFPANATRALLDAGGKKKSDGRTTNTSFSRTRSWLGVTICVVYKKQNNSLAPRNFPTVLTLLELKWIQTIPRLCYHGNDVNYHTSGLVCLHHWAGSMSRTLRERPAANQTNCTNTGFRPQNPPSEEDRNLNTNTESTPSRSAFSRTKPTRNQTKPNQTKRKLN